MKLKKFEIYKRDEKGKLLSRKVIFGRSKRDILEKEFRKLEKSSHEVEPLSKIAKEVYKNIKR